MPRFEPVEDIIDSLCLRTGDIGRRMKGLYLDCAIEVWDDMNEGALKLCERIKMPVRKEFFINKMTNSIDLPFDVKKVNSVSIRDRFGNLYPVYRNDKVDSDLVDISVIGNCACENNCAYHLCNTIKGYEAVTTVKADKNPDGSDVEFTCIDKKVVVGEILYQQFQYPEREYLSGVWTRTYLKTENKQLCTLEVDSNGCVCDTQSNIDAVCNSCGINTVDTTKCCIGGTSNTPPDPNCHTWIYSCINKLDWFNVQCGGLARMGHRINNIYNITSTGKQLIFPANFGWGSVVIRFFEDIDLFDIVVPYIAKPAFMAGLQLYAATNHERKQQLAAVFSKKYSALKQALLNDLNKYTVDEYQMILTPPVYIPSYLSRGFIDNSWWNGIPY